MQFDARGVTPLVGEEIRQTMRCGGSDIGVTTHYLTKDGRAWLPVMGELHYSRILQKDWEKELLKMKDGGVEIISSYVFWLHHETEPGKFNWEGNYSLRAFIQLCEKHSLYFFLRPGPWAHGECRNGGFPDWLDLACHGKLRCMDKVYLGYVKRFFREIADQTKVCRNIIGVQAENEMMQNHTYLLEIKKLLLESGLCAPLFTATAWGDGAPFPVQELLPVFGGYPEAPWEQHTKKLPPHLHNFFTKERNDAMIGTDVLSVTRQNQENGSKSGDCQGTVPFLTCEIGGGNQVTYHRRPLISAKDVFTIPFTMLGSGCNLLGYYMYHGGSNPVLHGVTTQESRETGYLNDYPVCSYDFQAPIGECGQIRPSYTALNLLHQFVKSFGERLCHMESLLPDMVPRERMDTKTLRAALRTDGVEGFLFLNNLQRNFKMPAHENITLSILLQNREILLEKLYLASDSCCIIPVGLTIGGKRLKYATAQPLSVERGADGNEIWRFLPIQGNEPLCYFEEETIALTESGVLAGNTILKLEHPRSFVPERGRKLALQCVHESIPFTQFRYLGLTDKTREFLVTWDENETYLLVDPIGNVAQAYHEGKLIADWFCYGDTWVIDVRDLFPRSITIKVQPLTEEDNIYLEVPMERNTCKLSVKAVQGETVFMDCGWGYDWKEG